MSFTTVEDIELNYKNCHVKCPAGMLGSSHACDACKKSVNVPVPASACKK